MYSGNDGSAGSDKQQGAPMVDARDPREASSLLQLQTQLRSTKSALDSAEQRCQDLNQQLASLRREHEDMEAALYDAAGGDPSGAELFVAAGKLGLRDHNRADFALQFDALSVPPLPTDEIGMRTQISRTLNVIHSYGASSVVVNRLWMEPQLAPHFRLAAVVENGHRILLEAMPGGCSPIPCELFARKVGSPRFSWRFGEQDVLSVQVVNVSRTPKPFRMIALGRFSPASLALGRFSPAGP